mgnify:CR=1 FL=1
MEDTEIVNLFFARSEGAIAETQRKYDWVPQDHCLPAAAEG